MLPTDLLRFRIKDGLALPYRVKPTPTNLKMAELVIATYEGNLGKRRLELKGQLAELEAGRQDWKAVRGMAHLLGNMSTFETGVSLEPVIVRARAFALAQGQPPSRRRAGELLEQLSRELPSPQPVTAQDVQEALYGDLEDQQLLTVFDPPTPAELCQRLELAYAQGMLYRAVNLIITARRNEPAHYKQILRYLKLFGLMATVEGDASHGFTLTLDGPMSLFQNTTRYGLAMAKFLPALLHVTKWDLSATLKPIKLAWLEEHDSEWSFQLTSEDGYVSHYKPPEEHDSALESGFTERFQKLDTPWQLEREVDLVPVPGSVILPDFRLVHPEGRSALVEIVGYWRPDYLRKKFDLLKKSGRQDVIVCISERLQLDKAGVDPSELGDRAVWFKGVLPPKDVLAVAERIAVEAA